jgi:hypothetical protein
LFGNPCADTTFQVIAWVDTPARRSRSTVRNATAVYRVSNGNWTALATGSSPVCEGLNIPANIASRIGC